MCLFVYLLLQSNQLASKSKNNLQKQSVIQKCIGSNKRKKRRYLQKNTIPDLFCPLAHKQHKNNGVNQIRNTLQKSLQRHMYTHKFTCAHEHTTSAPPTRSTLSLNRYTLAHVNPFSLLCSPRATLKILILSALPAFTYFIIQMCVLNAVQQKKIIVIRIKNTIALFLSSAIFSHSSPKLVLQRFQFKDLFYASSCIWLCSPAPY